MLIIYAVSQAKASTTLTFSGHNLGNNSDFGPVTKAIFVPDGGTAQYQADAAPGAAVWAPPPSFPPRWTVTR
ncbi:hypothetical protein BLA60_18265 [Actinophytocola xinjiangensis]|uniref:Uncharacterized protein n=1 Tax=Actinophytocola xinjiangensis TaxID=485602 RepID=A0A7Z0WPC8_9PSEU|nr:hypothetical protein BLA60_18265 [Actinophytocola xinjiangensis]